MRGVPAPIIIISIIIIVIIIIRVSPINSITIIISIFHIWNGNLVSFCYIRKRWGGTFNHRNTSEVHCHSMHI